MSGGFPDTATRQWDFCAVDLFLEGCQFSVLHHVVDKKAPPCRIPYEANKTEENYILISIHRIEQTELKKTKK